MQKKNDRLHKICPKIAADYFFWTSGTDLLIFDKDSENHVLIQESQQKPENRENHQNQIIQTNGKSQKSQISQYRKTVVFLHAPVVNSDQASKRNTLLL